MNLKELSQVLNLSQTTVSRALNGYPEVNEATRRRVMEAARAHGYQPNAAARRLATGKANAIGCVIPAGGMTPQFMEFLAGVNELAGRNRQDVVLANADDEGEESAYRRLASHGQVDGVFLFPILRNDPRIDLLAGLNLPFVSYGRPPNTGATFAHLETEVGDAFHNAARLLLQLGHARIALLNGPKALAASALREDGVRRAMSASKAELPRSRVLNADLSERAGYEAASGLLASEAPPTGILCASLFAALGVQRAAAERGLSIGADLSLIAQDDGFAYLDPETFPVPLTTIRAPLRKAGRRVAERLHARISGVEKEPKGEVWSAELVVRASIGPPRR